VFCFLLVWFLLIFLVLLLVLGMLCVVTVESDLMWVMDMVVVG